MCVLRPPRPPSFLPPTPHPVASNIRLSCTAPRSAFPFLPRLMLRTCTIPACAAPRRPPKLRRAEPSTHTSCGHTHSMAPLASRAHLFFSPSPPVFLLLCPTAPLLSTLPLGPACLQLLTRCSQSRLHPSWHAHTPPAPNSNQLHPSPLKSIARTGCCLSPIRPPCPVCALITRAPARPCRICNHAWPAPSLHQGPSADSSAPPYPRTIRLYTTIPPPQLPCPHALPTISLF